LSKIEEVMRSEISRLAKRAVKKPLESLEAKVTELRRTISSLSKTVASLEKRLGGHVKDESGHKPRLSAPEEQVSSSRFTPLLIKKLRKRLALTQDDLALILGVSKGAVVSWESGRSKPRQAYKEGLVALRGLGRREINKLLVEKGKVPKKRKRRKRRKAK